MNSFPKLLKITLGLLFLSVLLFPSCVAKKKFIAMEESRNRAENRVSSLTKEVKHIQIDFNDYENEFQFNNAFKDNYIDSLNKVVVGLNTLLMSKNENIEDQQLTEHVEKKRLNQMLASRDLNISNLESQVKLLQNQVDALKAQLQDKSIQVRNLTNDSNVLENKVIRKEKSIMVLNDKVEKGIKDIALLRKEIIQKDEKIDTLQNQVKLLKKQFGEK